jgi:hypothetical protein
MFMTLNEKDNERLQELLNSLKKYKVKHKMMEKNTRSLYRFGIFQIYGKEYFISSWNFIDKKVIFEDNNGNKVKYDIKMNKGEFRRFTFFSTIKNLLKKGKNDRV